jgi:hypothetical protein
MTQEIVVDLSKVPWTTHRGKYEIQVGLDGSQGPELVRARFSGREVEPHYHRAAQFQLLLDGNLQFPDFRMEGIAVHYTDHNVPYGPFTTSGRHDMVVVHAKPAGVQYMKNAVRDPGLRKEINRAARFIVRRATSNGRPCRVMRVLGARFFFHRTAGLQLRLWNVRPESNCPSPPQPLAVMSSSSKAVPTSTGVGSGQRPCALSRVRSPSQLYGRVPMAQPS